MSGVRLRRLPVPPAKATVRIGREAGGRLAIVRTPTPMVDAQFRSTKVTLRNWDNSWKRQYGGGYSQRDKQSTVPYNFEGQFSWHKSGAQSESGRSSRTDRTQSSFQKVEPEKWSGSERQSWQMWSPAEYNEKRRRSAAESGASTPEIQEWTTKSRKDIQMGDWACSKGHFNTRHYNHCRACCREAGKARARDESWNSTWSAAM